MRTIIPNVLYEVNGLYFETIDISLDEPACMNCHKLVKDGALRMWTSEGDDCRELHFCFSCAKNLGVFDAALIGRDREETKK